MYLVGRRRCPTCGIRGKIWKRKPKIFVCPNCNAIFNDFGIILEPIFEKEVEFS